MTTIYTANKVSPGDYNFGHAWYATRTMLKAGWLLKNSSNGSSKATISATSNPADPTNCMWGAPAAITGQSGSLASIGTQFGKDFLITGLTGLVTASNINSGGSEGNILTFASASAPGNNVNWMISQVIDATQCYARPLVPSAVTASGTSPPVMSIVGHLARTRIFNLRVETVTIGALGTAQVKISLDGGSTFASTVTVPSTGFVEVIDNNGVATGIYLVFAGAINNANNIWTSTTAAANDPNNGSISWTEKSWLTTTYPTLGTYAWVVLEGPATLRIPFTSIPAGTFIRGENLVQSSTGAEGELMGITYDANGGYMIVSPRLQGVGIGPEGWSAAYTITGTTSGVTVIPSTSPTRLVREQVWTRGSIASTTNSNGALFYQPVLDSSENSQRFGWLSLQAGCVAATPPGCGGTNNAFPSVAYAAIGRGGTTPVSNASWNFAWTNQYNCNTTTIGRLQMFTANCIDRQNQSCDGSFVGLIGIPALSATATGCLPLFMRLDGGEEGDLEPYAMWTVKTDVSFNQVNYTTRVRDGNDYMGGGSRGYTGASDYGGQPLNPWQGSIIGYGPETRFNGSPPFIQGWWMTWWRRGLSTIQPPSSTTDSYLDAVPTIPYCTALGNYHLVYANNITTDNDTIAHSNQNSLPITLQPIELTSQPGLPGCARKGYLRWLFLTTGANGSIAYDTFANKSWIQCASSYGANLIHGLKIVMPYDGSSIPLQ